MVEKVIVSNRAALIAKYGKGGFGLVSKALAQLAAADSDRGLRSRTVWIDDDAAMKSFGGKPPINAKDQKGAKLAVDAVADSLQPEYLVLLDGPDVIPHIVLDNPVPQDGDVGVESDLPYASPSPFSRVIARYLTVTRVVTRMPNLPKAKDPKRLIDIINASAKAKPKPEGTYAGYFGISADVWRDSTKMSLDAVFSDHDALYVSPPNGPPATGKRLTNLSHFINCHGAAASPEFYGQKGGSFPVALNSAQVSAKAVGGTIVAAECCFGAQLYDPELVGTDVPICVAYLERGALGFLGSTNIAYGPSDSNGQADLITQYFLEHVTSGASLGRGFLQARQRFIANSKMTDPTNLKTLAQFILLGDASTTLCEAPKQYSAAQGHSAASLPKDEASQRKSRRAALVNTGFAVAAGKAVPVGKGSVPPAVRHRVLALARSLGFLHASMAVFGVRKAAGSGGKNTISPADSVMVFTKKQAAPKKVVVIRHLVAHIVDDGIASIDEVVSR